MCRKGTLWAVLAGAAWAQTPADLPQQLRPDWRRIGNSAVEYSLASVATGPVERVWFSEEGALVIRTASGKLFETRDFETWRASTGRAAPPPERTDAPLSAPFLPEPAARFRTAQSDPSRVYAFARHVHSSANGGRAWRNLTSYKGFPIIGEGVTDLAVAPGNPDEIVVANRFGVWRSVDGGLSWTGLNELLPNLPVRRFAGTPQGARGTRLILESPGSEEPSQIEWAPGEKRAWRVSDAEPALAEKALRAALSVTLGADITAVEAGGTFVYAGSQDGSLWVSSDQGSTWLKRPGEGAPVRAIHLDPREGRRALAVFGSRADGVRTPRVARTLNGGLFWDDLSANLPNVAAHGIAADWASGAIYVATENGVFMTAGDLLRAAPATPWSLISGNLPSSPARDVRLDPAGNQLYVALEGYGVYACLAPHRLLSPRVVSAADYSQRPAAPGALLSVLGGRVRSARIGNLTAPVLAAALTESQIQVPFEAGGPAISLDLEAEHGKLTVGLPLETVSPAVFVDQDGTPVVLDAESGLLLDAMHPARSGGRLQILASGLGRVDPQWPTGLAAPLDSPPRVVAPLEVFLDRVPLEVTRATLAPGYIGYYLVEVELPEIVNAGPAELYIQSQGRQSNHVRIYLAP